MRALLNGQRRLTALQLLTRVAIGALALAVGLGMWQLYSDNQNLRHTLYTRCLTAQQTREARLANLHGDLHALLGQRHYYRVLSADPSLAPSVARLVSNQADRISNNIAAKQRAIRLDVLRPCGEFKSAQGGR